MTYFNTHTSSKNSLVAKRLFSAVLGWVCLLGPQDDRPALAQNAPTGLPAPAVANQTPTSQSGNLRGFHFESSSGRYTINGIQLPKVLNSTCFLTADRSYKVHARFLPTVLLVNGKPVDDRNKGRVKEWSTNIPRVAKVIEQQDALGTLKLVSYELIQPRNHHNIQIQEQLTLLWSADPTEAQNAGHTGFGPLMEFSAPVIDVQYRAASGTPNRLFKKMFLQILHIQEGGYRTTLGAFVLVSKSSGDYEFYLVPRSVLDEIVIGTK